MLYLDDPLLASIKAHSAHGAKSQKEVTRVCERQTDERPAVLWGLARLYYFDLWDLNCRAALIDSSWRFSNTTAKEGGCALPVPGSLSPAPKGKGGETWFVQKSMCVYVSVCLSDCLSKKISRITAQIWIKLLGSNFSCHSHSTWPPQLKQPYQTQTELWHSQVYIYRAQIWCGSGWESTHSKQDLFLKCCHQALESAVSVVSKISLEPLNTF